MMLGAMVGGLTFASIFVIGLFSGVPFFSLLIRGALAGLLLGVLGFGLGFLIERFVPDAWNTSNNEEQGAESYGGDAPGYPSSASPDGNSQGGIQDIGARSALDYTVGDEEGSSAHVALPDITQGDGMHTSSPGPRRASRSATGDGTVVGNRRVINEMQFTDDPEEYAKAIRTMMNKDDD
jgi:hypothetical protein